MHRQLLSYSPASLLPTLVSVAAIYAFTRLLSLAEFEDYTLLHGLGVRSWAWDAVRPRLRPQGAG
jgi:hypothetical protein